LLKKGFPAIVEKKLGKKQEQMIYSAEEGKTVKVITTPAQESARFCLTNSQILQLSNWVMIIEDYYTKLNGNGAQWM
jgi:pyruvate,water dikinase